MFLVTERAIVACAHGPGISPPAPSQHFVRIGGARVLVRGDTAGRPVVGCPPIPPLKPCISTLNETSGHSAFIRIAGVPVSLDPLTGKTDGDPQGGVTYSVRAAGQSFVSQR